MVSRDNNDKLVFEPISFQIMIGDMFDKCKTTEEMAFLYENMQGSIEVVAEEMLDLKKF